jgi:FkbM family methyltransferase
MNIVQIGCNDGNDHVYNYIVKNIDSIKNIYLIDASKESIKNAELHYKDISNVKFFNIGICESEDMKELEIFYAENLSSEHLSFRKNHHTDHGNPNDISSFNVKSMTINNFIKENNIDIVDILYIDAEGLDCRIVQSIDFKTYDIKKIHFEHQHCENTFSEGNCNEYINVIGKLKEYGYLIEKNGPDTIAVKVK